MYFALTFICAMAYMGFGMSVFDGMVHAMTTVATGGFANYDASFAAFDPAVEYVAVLFMLLAALPFVRYVQLISGSARPVFRDSQVRVFFLIILATALLATLWVIKTGVLHGEEALRKALFNVTSIVTGTGYASTDYMTWGAFAVVLFFFIGLIGGCAGSTSCSIKVFRYQLLIASVVAQIRRIHSPSGLFEPRYEGRTVSEDVLSSVMSFFVFFIVTLGVLAVLLSATGLDIITALSGAAAALANIGPGLGPEIGPTGNYANLNETAKWILAAAMLIGRLELLAIYAVLTARFWQA